ncbi:hypothetical protein [Nostoc sp.]|uniref:hypothetical protein n=1 Tax=Nostoc sp. TaxID=1180 RepID=UPI002FF7E8CA
MPQPDNLIKDVALQVKAIATEHNLIGLTQKTSQTLIRTEVLIPKAGCANAGSRRSDFCLCRASCFSCRRRCA